MSQPRAHRLFNSGLPLNRVDDTCRQCRAVGRHHHYHPPSLSLGAGCHGRVKASTRHAFACRSLWGQTNELQSRGTCGSFFSRRRHVKQAGRRSVFTRRWLRYLRYKQANLGEATPVSRFPGTAVTQSSERRKLDARRTHLCTYLPAYVEQAPRHSRIGSAKRKRAQRTQHSKMLVLRGRPNVPTGPDEQQAAFFSNPLGLLLPHMA